MHLRSIVIAAFLVLGVTSLGLGQAHFGLRAAPTIGYMSGSYFENSGGGEWGVELGLHADVLLFANVEFVAGAFVLHQKGARKIKTVENDSLLGFKFGYMRFPFMLRPMFQIGDGPWHLGPFAGIYFGTGGGSCKVKFASYHGFSSDCRDDFGGGPGADVDYGIPFGVDLIAKFEGGARWEFYARVDYGLANVLDGADSRGFTAHHRLLTIGFGFSYPLY
jgi:hypothetical protein